jgi:hypothetical protein
MRKTFKNLFVSGVKLQKTLKKYVNLFSYLKEYKLNARLTAADKHVRGNHEVKNYRMNKQNY